MSNIVQASYRVEVDASKVNALLAALNDKEAKKAIKSGLRKSASIIRKQAQKNWVASVPGGASGARVDLLDKRRKGSKQFVLKFFESGTEQRATNRGANRGIIEATHFFKSAVDSKKSEAENSLERNILDSIQKVIDKKK